jgi:hypothetical protein
MSEESEQYRVPEKRDERWMPIYFGLFGKKLTLDEAIAIEAVLDEVFHQRKPPPWEIIKALKRIGRDLPPGTERKYAPNGEQIIKAIYANRREYAAKQAAPSVNGYSPHQCPPAYPSFDAVAGTHMVSVLITPQAWQDELRFATTPAERFNLITKPYAKEHVEQRKRFCQDNALAYEIYECDRLFVPGQFAALVSQFDEPVQQPKGYEL